MNKYIVFTLSIVILLLVLIYHDQRDKRDKGEGAIINPFMGFAPPAEGDSYKQAHSLVYANFTWKDLEAEKGVYDFDKIEEKYKFDYWRANNKRLIFRVVLDYPGAAGHMDIPDWLYDELKEDGHWYEHEWGSGFSPNYNNPKLINYHEKLIKALAKRYNQDPFIAFIELGSLGHWGEWHTLQQEGIDIPFPKLPIAETYVRHYTESFTDKILLMRRPHQIAIDNNMGLYNDMFGRKDHTIEEFNSWVTNGYTFWLTGEKNPPMNNAWKTAPIGGEFAPTKEWGDYFSSSAISETMEQLQETHVSWLGPSSPAYYSPNGKYQRKINHLLKKIGYHFRLRKVEYKKSAEAGTDLSLNMEWENSGVAPFYFDWPLEVSLADRNGKIIYKKLASADIRDWLPGRHSVKESIPIPNDLKKEVYKINVSILDPELMKPAIHMEMKGERDDLRYTIGEIEIR